MKAKNSNFGQIAPRAAQTAKIFFFCGPDEAGAHAGAAKIISLLGDAAGERIDIGGGELKGDPVRLSDETRSSSLFGGGRHIFVRAHGEEASEALKILTEDENLEESWPVLIVASGTTDKSRSAKLLEKRDDALVAMFYPPDLRSVTMEVRQLADAAGLRMGTELAQRIAASVGLDVRMAASEITKLSLYLDAASQAPRTVNEDDLDAIGAKTKDDGLMPLVDTVLSGNLANLPHELARFRQMDISPVGAVLAMQRRVALLIQLSAAMGSNKDAQAFVARQPSVFFKDRAAVGDQLEKWKGPRLSRLSHRLLRLHRQLLSDSQGASIRFIAECTNIGRAALRK